MKFEPTRSELRAAQLRVLVDQDLGRTTPDEIIEIVREYEGLPEPEAVESELPEPTSSLAEHSDVEREALDPFDLIDWAPPSFNLDDLEASPWESGGPSEGRARHGPHPSVGPSSIDPGEPRPNTTPFLEPDSEEPEIAIDYEGPELEP